MREGQTNREHRNQQTRRHQKHHYCLSCQLHYCCRIFSIDAQSCREGSNTPRVSPGHRSVNFIGRSVFNQQILSEDTASSVVGDIAGVASTSRVSDLTRRESARFESILWVSADSSDLVCKFQHYSFVHGCSVVRGGVLRFYQYHHRKYIRKETNLVLLNGSDFGVHGFDTGACISSRTNGA